MWSVVVNASVICVSCTPEIYFRTETFSYMLSTHTWKHSSNTDFPSLERLRSLQPAIASLVPLTLTFLLSVARNLRQSIYPDFPFDYYYLTYNFRALFVAVPTIITLCRIICIFCKYNTRVSYLFIHLLQLQISLFYNRNGD